MLDRIPALPVLVVWGAYCTAVTVIGASDHFELSLFFLFVPAQILLGLLVPRGWVIAAPIALMLLLGWLAFEAACPCREDGIGFFYVLWTYFFAAPGILLIGLGIAARRVAVSAA